ncbi:MAG: glycosyltransferase family 8 protein, partial [Spirochaetaceae bacterium]|nr:glycosyltransferase family 8 protein [Spirochaetaceae bacterium]
MENDVVPICFCADDKFIPYTAAAIQSIMENANPDTVYKLYILFSDISEKRMNLLREQVSAYKNFSLDFIDVKIYIDKYDLNSAYTNIMYGRKEIYFRLFIPYIFSNYSKIIYLDSDIICLADIAKIISGNSGCIVEVVRDCGAVRGSKKYASGLGLKKPENYFNSGVIVFNTSLFKQNISEEKLFSYINKPYDFPDQDILNIVCEGNVDFLELSWNVMGVDMNKRITTKFKNEYNISQKNPYIIHYGGDKPWKNFIITRRTKYFWEFARRTKFADIIYLGLKDIDIAELSHHDDVYAGIYEGQRYGLRFVVKCGFLWLAMKLNALKTRIGRAPERINPPPPPCEFYRPFKRCEQKYKQTSLSYVKVKNKYSSNG